MVVSVIYILPQINQKLYHPMAVRFKNAYMENPPGEADHELYVCSNGGRITPQQERLFDPLVPTFIQHNNVGRDIGAYVMAAQTIPCDFLFCIGAHARPCKAGWLDRFVRALEDNGPGVFGPWAFAVPEVHIRTTVFAITPELLNAYPTRIDDSNRYQFEHSRNSITLWCLKQGFQAMQVTAAGVFPASQFHHTEKDECLFEDRHSDSLPTK